MALSDSTNTMETTQQTEAVHKPATAVESEEKPVETVDATATGAEKPAETVEAGEMEEEGEEEMEEEEAPETPEEKKQRLADRLIEGRRFFKLSDFPKAADVLSTASQLAGELFGDDSEEAFEPFYLYGQALLELAKVEDQILANAMSTMPVVKESEEPANDTIDEEKYGNPESLTDEERAQIKDDVENALAETVEKTVDSEEKVEGETTEKTVEAEDTESTETTKEQPTEVVKTENEKSTEEAPADVEDVVVEDVEMEEGENEDADGEDDEDSMKLAWEILESARRICEKKLDSLADSDQEDRKNWNLKKADVLIVLGEHSIADDGKFEQAQKDLKEALAIQKEHLEQCSRIMAQTNHLIGKSFRIEGKFEEAAAHFKEAKDILLLKSEKLRADIETAIEEERAEMEAELKELAALIPDMEAFVEDSKESAKQTEHVKNVVKKELESAMNAINTIGTEEPKEATDITNMIRRPTKRAASTDPSEEIAKKTKADDEVDVTSVDADEKKETPEESSVADA